MYALHEDRGGVCVCVCVCVCVWWAYDVDSHLRQLASRKWSPIAPAGSETKINNNKNKRDSVTFEPLVAQGCLDVCWAGETHQRVPLHEAHLHTALGGSEGTAESTMNLSAAARHTSLSGTGKKNIQKGRENCQQKVMKEVFFSEEKLLC